MKRGFSLIELLVVLLVLALLAALAAPPVLASIERGKVARVVADLRTVEVALEAYRRSLLEQVSGDDLSV